MQVDRASSGEALDPILRDGVRTSHDGPDSGALVEQEVSSDRIAPYWRPIRCCSKPVKPDKLRPSTNDVPERFEFGTLPYEIMTGATANDWPQHTILSTSTSSGCDRLLSAFEEFMNAR